MGPGEFFQRMGVPRSALPWRSPRRVPGGALLLRAPVPLPRPIPLGAAPASAAAPGNQECLGTGACRAWASSLLRMALRACICWEACP